MAGVPYNYNPLAARLFPQERTFWDKLADYGKGKAQSAFETLWGAATLPGDVYAGKVDQYAFNPQTGEVGPSPELMRRSADLAGSITLGAGAVPAVGAELGMGIRAIKAKPVDVTRNKAFRSWFGQSKLVDENDKPLVLYHGTTNADKILEGGFKKGWVHLTDSKEVADSYQQWKRGDQADTLKLYAKMENPAYFDAGGKKYTDIGNKIYDATYRAAKEGHDGLIIKNIRDNFDSSVPTKPHNTYVLFSPEHIKSVENQGSFNPADPRIMYGVAGGTAAGVVIQSDKQKPKS